MTNELCPVTQQRLVESEARQALAIKQRDELARLIKEHNQGIEDQCRCRNECRFPYPHCPKKYLIDLPETKQ